VNGRNSDNTKLLNILDGSHPSDSTVWPRLTSGLRTGLFSSRMPDRMEIMAGAEKGESVMRRQRNEGNIRQILGIKFFIGDARSAVERMSRGGLLVVPAAPALKDIDCNDAYRDALTNADVAIADSGFMVLLWNWLQRDSLRRLSGLTYLRELLLHPDVRTPCNTFWVMAGPGSARKNIAWLASQGIAVPSSHVYHAPMYRGEIVDLELVDRLQALRVKHVVITVGGGTQERLGLYIKRNLDYLPAIHCVGAAIAFLSGDQVRIPSWADRFYLGWFFRCVSAPGRYFPRYWSARKLVPLLWRYRDKLPPLQTIAVQN
jgi:UDP-N-acetyl-D-mannosaminuronic acid transferase (WecB/TagA/CpsF family)